jgi:hypothetical protein
MGNQGNNHNHTNGKGTKKGSATTTNPCRYVIAALFLTAAVFLLGRQPVDLPAETRVAKAAVQPIRQISILGERNSGTRWTYEYVYDYYYASTRCDASTRR